MHAETPHVIGLDIGGSTTRGCAAIGDTTVAEASAHTASAVAAERTGAERALADVLTSLSEALGRVPDAVCAGAAGSSVAGAADWLGEVLGRLTGARSVRVVSDAALVLPAAGHERGIAIVCGTGSIVYGCDVTVTARAGGWGYLLGDEGGAYRLVVESLRVLLARRDRGQAPGALGAALADAPDDVDLDRLLADYYADPRPRRWAARAPAVLACGDAAVGAMLRAGADGVARDAAAVAARLGLERSPIVLAGGFVAGRAVRRGLRAALREARPGWPVQALTAPPVQGAVALARHAALAGDAGSPHVP